MKLLIINLANTYSQAVRNAVVKAGFEDPGLRSPDFGPGFQSGLVFEVTNLDDAQPLLNVVDGVVCAQSVPTHRGRVGEPAETQSGNWGAVANDCRKLGKPFVLVCAAGNYRLSERFNQMAQREMAAWPSFALLEPVDAEWVAETIVTAAKWSVKRQDSGIAERAGIDMVPEQAA